jgi:HKD family nuclease
MTTKTFKIGEYAKGGVITVEIKSKDVAVIAKEWDFKAGSSKNSDQSNAKEFDREEVNVTDPTAYRKLHDFLNDQTTHYYAEQVLNYIKEHCNLILTY